jgi:trehalose/maltose hydrolase-like predicted phosphorylase
MDMTTNEKNTPGRSDEAWSVCEENLPKMDERAVPVLFTLGNGLIEVNGSGPLDPPGSGWTLHGRVYGEGAPQIYYFPPPESSARSPEFKTDRDCMRHVTPSLVVLPNGFATQLRFAGRRVQRPLSTRRRLDMRRGLLESHCEVVLPEGELEVHSMRAVVPDDQNLLVERLEITSDRPGLLEVTLLADATRLSGYDKYELRRHCEGQVLGDDTVTWSCEAEGTGDRAAVALTARGPAAAEARADANGAGLTFRVTLEAGKSALFERFVSVAASWMHADPGKAARAAVASAAAKGAGAHLSTTERVWGSFWQEHDIVIEGPLDDQQAVRFALFQLRCATPPTPALSFGAKFLSGEGYRDCVFWDTDIFIIPYFTRCQPEIARRHGVFRQHGLAAAKERARQQGFAGARYPWEALPDGREGLGPWVILSLTQVHVVCDVAWCIMDYYRWTKDDSFMHAEGADILAETARFWVSRVEKTGRGYELLNVCGPDECHEVVNNSIYTNLLARENLRAAAQWNPDAPERAAWLDIAGKLVVATPNAAGLLEQFDGFFSLPDSLHLERVPGHYHGYQMLKQADVLMLPLVLPGYLTSEQVAVNYRYYEPRTWHWSSLSEAAHSQVAAQVGLAEDAYRMFRNNMLTDLADRQKSAHCGLHAGALGMVPRNVIEGFAGLQLEGDKPVAIPQLPAAWKSVTFRFSFAGKRYQCRVESARNGQTVEPEPEES